MRFLEEAKKVIAKFSAINSNHRGDIQTDRANESSAENQKSSLRSFQSTECPVIAQLGLVLPDGIVDLGAPCYDQCPRSGGLTMRRVFPIISLLASF